MRRAADLLILPLVLGVQSLRVGELAKKDGAASTPALLQHDLDIIAAQASRGLYADPLRGEFKNTVLITAGNFGFLDFLLNWGCHADALGLNYVIVALDAKTYERFDPNRTVLAQGVDCEKAESWHQGHYYEIVCMKTQLVAEVVDKLGVDVVFTDPDNVFREDPFSTKFDLGRKMRDPALDYVHQLAPGGIHDPIGHPGLGKTNPGFFFMRGSTEKRRGLVALQHTGLSFCYKGGSSEQGSMKKALAAVINGTAREMHGQDNFACADICHHGLEPRSCNAPAVEVIGVCNMDPRDHPDGGFSHLQGTATYHATYVMGKQAKISKLAKHGLWNSNCTDERRKKPHSEWTALQSMRLLKEPGCAGQEALEFKHQGPE